MRAGRTGSPTSLRPTRASVVTLAAVALGSAVLLPHAGLASHGLHGHGIHGHGAQGHGSSLPMTIRVEDVELTVQRAERLADGHAGANSPQLPMGGPAMPMVGSGHIEGATSSGQERVAVSVRLRNTGVDAVPYDALELVLLADGRPVELLRPVESTLGAGVLPPGARVDGQVYFVIADGTQGLAVRHEGSAREIPLPDDVQPSAAPGGHAH